MNEEQLKSFLKGDFKAECYRIELSRGGTYPLRVEGPGVIELDKNGVLNFRAHLDEASIKALLEDLNRPIETGKLIPREGYFQFTANSYNLPVWEANLPGVGCSMGFGNGGIAYGTLPEVITFSPPFTKECTKDIARLFLRGEVEFPENGITETEIKRGGRTRHKSSRLDFADFEIGREKFELLKHECGTELACSFEKGGICGNRHIRITEAMQFALGQQFRPCALELAFGKTQVTILRSTRSKPKQKVCQYPPLNFKGKIKVPEVFEIAEAYYTSILKHTEEKWHPVSSQVHYILQAGSAAVELRCLALGVAAEGIADICHQSLATVSAEFKGEVDTALEKISQIELTEVLANRIKGAIGNMKRARGSDRIREFVDQNKIDQSIFTSWQRVRNAAAHGGILNSSDLDKTLSDLNNVLYLCYAMLLSFCGYNGVRTNYSQPNFPDETPK
jgi:hypothetical protein